MVRPFAVDVRRVGTNSVKWDLEGQGDPGVFACSIADLDFSVAPRVMSALRERLSHPVLGYTFVGEEARAAVVDWYRDLHHVAIGPRDVVLLPFGPRAALQFVARNCIRPGDVILVPSPTYAGLLRLGRPSGAVVVQWPMTSIDNRPRLDLDWLGERAWSVRPTVLAICNPSNPLGTVVARPDLANALRILGSSLRLVISDEVHGDLVYRSVAHDSALTLEGEPDVLVLSGVGKTFNLSGLSTSYLITRDEALRDALGRSLDAEGFYEGSLLGVTAQTTALRGGRVWRDHLVLYLEKTAADLVELIAGSQTGLSATHPQASFLLWVDFRKTGLETPQVSRALAKARVVVQFGDRFGTGGEGHFRYNFGCSRSRAVAGMRAIIGALRTATHATTGRGSDDNT